MRRIWGGGGSLYAENAAGGGFTICVENWPESLPSVDNFVERVGRREAPGAAVGGSDTPQRTPAESRGGPSEGALRTP